MKCYIHAGLFHADEVVAYSILLMAEVVDGFVRLTDLNNIPSSGIVVDIGREYDPDNKKFDHHQGFLTRDDGYPYASAGLIWKHYGKLAIEKHLNLSQDFNLTPDFIEQVWKRVDDFFIKGIDAHDSDNNYLLSAACSAGNLKVMSFSNIISTFNSKYIHDEKSQNLMFSLAVDLNLNVLDDHITKSAEFVRDRENFSKFIKRENNVLILDFPMSWKEIVHYDYPDIRFVIHESNHPGSPYCIISVPTHYESRELHIPIERPDWFTEFIHQGRWIAGSISIEKLIKLAEYSTKVKEG